MKHNDFWSLIESTKQKDTSAHAKVLTERLAAFPVEDILDFDRLWHDCLHEAYHWDLWGAAYLINGGCSDHGFEYFRIWLLLQGSAVYHAAISNPDTLADVLNAGDEAECECYPGSSTWFAATGIANDRLGYEQFWESLRLRHGIQPSTPDLGEGWDFDDERQMRKRYPRLAQMYQ